MRPLCVEIVHISCCVADQVKQISHCSLALVFRSRRNKLPQIAKVVVQTAPQMRGSIFPSHGCLDDLMKSAQSQFARHLHLATHSRLYPGQPDRDNEIFEHHLPRHKMRRTKARFRRNHITAGITILRAMTATPTVRLKATRCENSTMPEANRATTPVALPSSRRESSIEAGKCWLKSISTKASSAAHTTGGRGETRASRCEMLSLRPSD